MVQAHTGDRQVGSVLVSAMILVTMVLAFVLATLVTTTLKVREASAASSELSARYVAQAGLEMQINDLRNMRDMASMGSPYNLFDDLDTDNTPGTGHYTQTYVAGDANSRIVDSTGAVVGEFEVVVDVTNPGTLDARELVIVAFGYVPSKAAVTANTSGSAVAEVRTVSKIEVDSAAVFDYSYFINHWGWFYGNTIITNGNVRANGQFDFGGYGATINGSPRYERAEGWDLIGYIDDNGDGVTDGSDGGAYAGWNILSAENVNGMGGDVANQHPWQPETVMPNLTDLGYYEDLATSEGSSITIGGTTLVSGVVGDNPGEADNLYLVGTAANPIVLDGTIVVRGDVIISGVVTGQGSIYAGRNVYVADSLTYANGPTTDRPASNDEATVEAWRQANVGADALGLFAREHVVIGDYTNSTWQSYVSGWVNHSLNKSAEDAGADGIQNTADGPDGIAGTADDDLLEDDGVFTVDYYTAADAAAGLIPAGSTVGDVIPGSGEDLDGDGVYDGTTQMSDFDIAESLDPANWEGLTTSYSDFSDISTIYLNNIDASFFTNHTFAALMLAFGDDITMNGSIISRNESIIYGADHIYMNHDERMTGGSVGANYGLSLPISWEPIGTTAFGMSTGTSVDQYIANNVQP